jgi:4-alpha-glucanotransferase
MRLRPRASGILLHPTSLPGGRLGREAYRFVDWLAAAGQSWWQMLPLGPPDVGGSPYTSASAFAGSPDLLAEPDAPVTRSDRAAFEEQHRYWIRDWIEFAGPDAVEDQVRFQREWTSLRTYALRHGVRLFGDLPIYVAAGSADHIAHPHLFQRGAVAGAPPDVLSEQGQLWGHPLYDWPAHRAQGYRWWIDRFRRTFELVDLTRIDHFRGFVSYWAVPEGARTARRGRWRRGPGISLFRAAEAELGPLQVVAEDLGVITPAVNRLREELGFPGMYVLQFGFGGGPSNPHRPENHREHGVVYTGTHDTDTAVGWWESLDAATRERTGLDLAQPHWSLIELALSSRARLAIIPAQDVLGLGSEARMNHPGESEGNWMWRLEPGQLTERHAGRLHRLTEQYGRVR